MSETGWGRRAIYLDPVSALRDRHGRLARAVTTLLDGYDDDEIELRPWELGLPRVAVLALARSRGFEPVGGEAALVERGMWLEPMRLTRAGAAGGAPSGSRCWWRLPRGWRGAPAAAGAWAGA